MVMRIHDESLVLSEQGGGDRDGYRTRKGVIRRFRSSRGVTG